MASGMPCMAFMQSLIASSGGATATTVLCVSACIDAPAHSEMIGASGSATAIKIASMIRKYLRTSLLLVSQNAQCRDRVNARFKHFAAGPTVELFPSQPYSCRRAMTENATAHKPTPELSSTDSVHAF